MRKPRSYGEVYNELDSEVVNVFRVLRDPILARELERAVYLTPFSRDEFLLSYEPADDPVEQARRTIFRGFAAHGSTGTLGEKTGFRNRCTRTRVTDSGSWASYPPAIAGFVERLRGVVIENQPAIDVMLHHDGPDVLHYVDPPYLEQTRSAKRGGRAYRYEMSTLDHVHLAQVLHQLQGHVVLSGYPSPLYDELYADWKHEERPALTDGGTERIECLWIRTAAGRPILPRRLQQGQMILGFSNPTTTDS